MASPCRATELQLLDHVVDRLQAIDAEIAVLAAQLRLLGQHVDAHQLGAAGELIESVTQSAAAAAKRALADVAEAVRDLDQRGELG